MPIWPNRIQRVAVSSPAEALGAVRKIVLVLHGDRPSIPAVKTTDPGLVAGLLRRRPEDPEVFSEYLHPSRFPAAQYGDDLVRSPASWLLRMPGAATSAFVSRYRSSRKAREDQENRASRREAKEA